MSRAGFYAYRAGTRAVRIYTEKPTSMLDHFNVMESWLFEKMFRVHLPQSGELVFVHTDRPKNVNWKRI